jgi:nicotinamidase-related amidase
MLKIGDKTIFNTIEEILHPSHTALVVWDVIHASTRMIFNKKDFSRNLNSIVECARESDIPIFFTPILSPSKRFESSAILYTRGKLGFNRMFEKVTDQDMDFTIDPNRMK